MDSYYPKHAEYKRPSEKSEFQKAYEAVKENRDALNKTLFYEDWNCFDTACPLFQKNQKHAHVRIRKNCPLSALF